VRIEDVDIPRCIPGADQLILQQLATCGLVPDATVMWQSQRGDAYQAALDALIAKGWAYPCGCSRKEIEDAQALMGHARERHTAAVYPGICRDGLNGKAARAWRLNVQRVIDDLKLPTPLTWQDRLLGKQQQDVAKEVGDFVLRRADGLWAYQLAVVVDDAAQGVTHIVRGADLTDNTARQIVLQRALGLPTPSYMHTPLVLGENREKLSKQNGATALDMSQPLLALQTAAQALGLSKPSNSASIEQALTEWTKAWPSVTRSVPR
jgi:glutamyl-Q tRNA(Asp) synthetase